MKKNEKVYLEHIIESIDNVEDFIKNVSESDFLSSVLIQNGVVRCLEIIGEAVKNLPLGFREKHPDIEWKKIAGLRDILIHAYFEVDLDLTWIVAKEELPELKKKIRVILEDMEKQE